MRAAKVQASLRIRAVSPEPPLLAHRSSESRGTFRQKARSVDPLNGWACAVEICHDGMLEDTNSLDGAQLIYVINIQMNMNAFKLFYLFQMKIKLISLVKLKVLFPRETLASLHDNISRDITVSLWSGNLWFPAHI